MSFMSVTKILHYWIPLYDYYNTIPKKDVYISVVLNYLYSFTSYKKNLINKIQNITVIAWTKYYPTALILLQNGDTI